MLSAALLLFPLSFLCAFLFVFSLLFGLFWVPGDHGGGEEQRLMTADWGLITAAGEAYGSGRGADHRGGESLMTADGGLITAAGEAYDSGREAHYWGAKGL